MMEFWADWLRGFEPAERPKAWEQSDKESLEAAAQRIDNLAKRVAELNAECNEAWDALAKACDYVG